MSSIFVFRFLLCTYSRFFFISRYGIIWRCVVCVEYIFFLFLSFYFDELLFFLGGFFSRWISSTQRMCGLFFLAISYGLRWKYLECYSNGRHVVMMLMWMPWLMLPAQMHSSVCRQNYVVHWTCYLMLQPVGPSPVQRYQDQRMVAQCISNESINAKFSKKQRQKKQEKEREREKIH